MAIKTASIIGGGVAGPALACALQRIGIQCTVFELRSGPATIGGAINMSPSACRILDHLGMLDEISKIGYPSSNIEMYSMSTGSNLGLLPFGSIEKYGYESLRIERLKLQQIMLEGAIKAGAKVVYNKKLVALSEDESSITATFEDGTAATSDILLGCDGIHSAVRTQYIEPERKPTYTGVSTACGYAPVSGVTSPIHFKEMGMNMSAKGSLLTTYSDAEKSTIFLAAVTEWMESKGEGC
jgi:salicylate hydroxylase